MSLYWLDVAFGFYMAVVIGGWYLAILLPSPFRSAWLAMTFKERVGAALCSSILFLLPADALYEVALLYLA